MAELRGRGLKLESKMAAITSKMADLGAWLKNLDPQWLNLGAWPKVWVPYWGRGFNIWGEVKKWRRFGGGASAFWGWGFNIGGGASQISPKMAEFVGGALNLITIWWELGAELRHFGGGALGFRGNGGNWGVGGA